MRKMKRSFAALFMSAAMTLTPAASAVYDETAPREPLPPGMFEILDTAEPWVNPFTDIKSDDWFYSYVQYVSQAGIFGGVSDTEFAPQGQMTRAMYVTALGRMHKLDTDQWKGSAFEDVAEDQYYAPYVAWAAENKIVDGVGNSLFDPDSPVTREAMATIIARYMSYAEKALPESETSKEFLDGGSISSWADSEAIQDMFDAGIFTGVNTQGGVNFEPLRQSTRAEVSALIERYIKASDQTEEGETPENPDGTQQADEEAIRAFLQCFIDGDFTDAEKLQTKELIEALNAAGGIEAFADELEKQYGEFKSVKSVTFSGENADGRLIYTAIMGTENDDATIYVLISPDSMISGLQPVANVEEPKALPEGFAETEVTVDAGTGFPLEGYIVKPEDTSKPVPAVLLIQGSGATNYDEIIGANRVFDKLAKGLAEQGIATLRYSKRNYSYPEIMQEKDYSINEEYVEDVIAASKLLARQEGIDKVYILGHSQGGMLAPELADRGAEVDGMILFAGTPRNLLDIGDDQQADMVAYYEGLGMTDIVNEYKELQKTWKAEREALEGMTAGQAKEAGTVYGYNAYYIYTLNQINGIETIKKLEMPTFIMQGSNDRQVYADKDYAIYKNELSGEDYVSMKLYDGLSHIFTPSSAKNILEAFNEYNMQADMPDAVFDDIASWIEEQAK